MITPARLFEEADAARFVSLHPHQFAQMRADGGGPRFTPFKGQPVYERAALRDWCSARLRNRNRNAQR